MKELGKVITPKLQEYYHAGGIDIKRGKLPNPKLAIEEGKSKGFNMDSLKEVRELFKP